MIALADMIAAPMAGDRSILIGASTPAASGTAITLYPVAQTRFSCISR